MRDHPHGHRGMTLMELTLALLVVAMIGVAVAAMTAAAGEAWTTRDHYRGQIADARVIQHRIADLVRQSRRVVAAYDTDGGRWADVLLWTGDADFPGQVNFGELTLISYDSQLDTLTLHRAELTDAERQQIATNPAMDPATVGTRAAVHQFRASSQVTGHLLADQVWSFDTTLGAGDESAYRFVEMRLSLAGTPRGDPLTQVIAAYVRAPDTDIHFQAGAGGGGSDGEDHDDDDGEGEDDA